MRCYCCNRNLSDYEATLRSAASGEYLDTCRKCLQDLNIEVLPNNRDPFDPAPDDFDDYGEEYNWGEEDDN